MPITLEKVNRGRAKGMGCMASTGQETIRNRRRVSMPGCSIIIRGLIN